MEDGRWMSIGVEARGEQRVSAEEPTIPAELSDVIEIKLFLMEILQGQKYFQLVG